MGGFEFRPLLGDFQRHHEGIIKSSSLLSLKLIRTPPFNTFKPRQVEANTPKMKTIHFGAMLPYAGRMDAGKIGAPKSLSVASEILPVLVATVKWACVGIKRRFDASFPGHIARHDYGLLCDTDKWMFVGMMRQLAVKD